MVSTMAIVVRVQLDVVETLTVAVRERRPVRLEYRYRGQGLRTVHPHALYRTPRGLACDVYQVAGYTSERRTLPGWRAMDVGQVISAEAEAGRFPLAAGYNPAAERYRGGIIAPLG
jgi:hypothetical protein